MLQIFRTMMLMILFTGNVFASEEAFTQPVFDRLQQQGASILVSIHADWCPTCRAQDPIIKKLLEKSDFKTVHALRVDFDQQKDIVKEFKAIKQSTLIVFKGGKEIDRSLGETDEQAIEVLLKKAL